MKRPYLTQRGKFKEGKAHPTGVVMLKVTDTVAQPFLYEYAEVRGLVNPDYEADLKYALEQAGFEPPPNAFVLASLGLKVVAFLRRLRDYTGR